VTTAHVLKAGFVFLSQVVRGGGVLCRVVCVCSLLVGLLCGGVRFGGLCTNCYLFLNDTAVLLLLFQKKYYEGQWKIGCVAFIAVKILLKDLVGM
jgi:hypothetical protein